MPDPQNRGGRWLQRTADRGPDYPEPEWQYLAPDRGILKITDLTSDAEPYRIIDIADHRTATERVGRIYPMAGC